MRKYLLAAALALPFALAFTPKASAGHCCPPTPVYKFGFSIGLCFKPFCGSDCIGGKKCHKCGPVGCPTPCGGAPMGGGGGCGPMGCCGAGPGGCGYGPINAGPWYSYYPYNAHFQSPAPTGYPYWSAPQTSQQSPMFGGNFQAPYMAQQQTAMFGGNYQAPQAAPYSYPAAQVQPCGYYQAPSYWYPR